MDLCGCESEEHEHGVGAGANATLLSDTLIVNRLHARARSMSIGWVLVRMLLLL
jgi:hypothetical protein